jgi:NADH-quinone oxidoreductase subunit E
MSKTNSEFLNADLKQQIDVWIAKFPAEQKQSAVISALKIAQQANGGWLTEEIMDEVAEYLDMPKIAVYEVATFYSMFYLEPCGRNKIHVCNNISCMLRGSEDVIKHLENKLNIKCGETSADGKITLKKYECLGSCVDAPVAQVNEKYEINLTPEKLDKIIEELD